MWVGQGLLLSLSAVPIPAIFIPPSRCSCLSVTEQGLCFIQLALLFQHVSEVVDETQCSFVVGAELGLRYLQRLAVQGLGFIRLALVTRQLFGAL